MGNIAKMIEAVRAERDRAEQELARLDEALGALQRLAQQNSQDMQARESRRRREKQRSPS